MRDRDLEIALRTIGLPLAIMLVAWATFFVLGGRGYLGPLDYPMILRIVAAMWVAAPVAGGVASRPVDGHHAVRAAWILAAVTGGVLFLLVAGGSGTCTPRLSGAAFAAATAACAATIGAGFGLGFLATRWVSQRRGVLPGVAIGAPLHLAMSTTGYWAFYSFVACP